MDGFDLETSSELEERLHSRLINEMLWDSDSPSFGHEHELEETIGRLLNEEHVMLSAQERTNLTQRLIDRIMGLGPIERYVRDRNVSEIMVNGPNSIWVQYRGEAASRRVYDVSFRDEEHIKHIIDQSSPMVDTRLRDGSRVNAVVRPTSLNGPILTIRKFENREWSLEQLVRTGTLPEQIAGFLKMCVLGRQSILVAGGTNAGKTTTLNALSSHIPGNERIVTIEDTAELQLSQQNLIRMETRPSSIEGTGEITIRDLVRNALRMKPDRIIVGECRGAEALDMLQAMNTGHDGSLTTIHANSPEDAMSRLETMVLMATSVNLPLDAVREQIRGSLRLVLQQRLYPDGTRRISSVGEVIRQSAPTGADSSVKINELFHFTPIPTPDRTVVAGYWECVGTPTPRFRQGLEELNARYDSGFTTLGRVG